MMILRGFRRYLLLLLLVAPVAGTMAQDHFIYLQTENGQPFYVKTNNKVSSSSTAGYLILPSVPGGEHSITLGFPKNEYKEQTFLVKVDEYNEGYLLKNMDDDGWALFNMQTLALIKGTRAGNAGTPAPQVANTPPANDPFSNMLADVVKDSSILVTQPIAAEPVKEVPVTEPVAKEETTAHSDNAQVAIAETVDSTAKEANPLIVQEQASEQHVTAPQQEIKPSAPTVAGIRRILLLRQQEGLELVYVDRGDDYNDTIRILVPAAIKRPNEPVIEMVQPANTEPANDPKELTITPTIVPTIEMVDSSVQSETGEKEQGKPAEIIIDQPQKAEQPQSKENENGAQIIVLPKVVTSSTVNSDCKSFADDSDFLRLRKKMAAENTNEDMIAVARKEFRGRCFSTEQIKNLSYLFLNDKGKYQFFDAAYAYTSDSNLYESLAGQLTDPYYLNRFRAMIRK